MKNWMKTAAAALLGAALCTAGATLSASAEGTAELVGDTVILSGNIERDDVLFFAQNDDVKKVVISEDGAVLPTDCVDLFRDYRAESIDLSGADGSRATNMRGMFELCLNLKSVKFGKMDTSNVATMERMFFLCKNLKSVDLSGLDTSELNAMSNMFSNCTSLEEVDLSGFNTSKVMYMSGMFEDCYALKSADLSSFDTRRTDIMQRMFCNCYALESVDLSSFRTDSLTGYEYMFRGCKSLKQIDLSSFKLNQYANLQYMFENCPLLETVYVTPDLWYLDGISQEHAFDGAPLLTGDIDGHFTTAPNRVTGASLSLDGKIGVNFYARLHPDINRAVLKVGNRIVEDYDAGRFHSAQVRTDSSYSDYYKFTCGVNATQAGVPIRLSVYDMNGNQTDLYNSDFVKQENGEVCYSVNDYIADSAQYADNAALTKLVKALDNYCKAASNFFCKTDLAVDGIGSVNPDDLQDVGINLGQNLASSKISLVFNSATSLRIYYPAGVNAGDATFRKPGDDEAWPTFMGETEYGNYIEIFDIPAKNLTAEYSVTVEGITGSITPLNYVKRVLEAENADGDLVVLAKALYVYAQAAKSYPY
ncbi:MAG: BspA family leucine-rich repeat surface protein [Oscillospiraceae bacterium]|nr:BspA family leucine-rich repeat surface protein [Oscillospiraceae bacterium]